MDQDHSKHPGREPVVAIGAVILLIAGAIFFGGIFKAAGGDIGALAAWFSGMASSTAVWVALRGHKKVAEQREDDRREKREAAALQVLLKLARALGHLITIRKFYRTETQSVAVKVDDQSTHVFVGGTLRTFDLSDVPSLTDEQENLFARSGEIEALLLLDAALSEYHTAMIALLDHRKASDSLAARAVSASLESSARLSLSYDAGDKETVMALFQKSSLTEVVSQRASEALQSAYDAITPVKKAMGRFVPGKFRIAINAAAAEAELKLPMPSLPSGSSHTRMSTLAPGHE